MSHPILKHFSYGHLTRPELKATSKLFHDLAHQLAATLSTGPEFSVALRKLLEAKDAAVRQCVEDIAAVQLAGPQADAGPVKHG